MRVEYKKSKSLPILNAYFIDGFNPQVHQICRKNNQQTFYHPSLKQYEITPEVYDLIKEVEPNRQETWNPISAEALNKPNNLTAMAEDYVFQELASDYMARTDNVNLFFDTGSGKTRTTLLAISKREPTRTLIICGLSALQEEWIINVKEHVPHLEPRIKIGGIGSKAKRLKALNELDDQSILIINIESMRSKDIVAIIQKWAPQIIALDECQVIINSAALQSQGVWELEAATRWSLSATPVLNNPLEWYNLLRWLRVHDASKTRFNNYYGDWAYDHWGHWKCSGYVRQEELQEMVDFVSIRFMKDGLGLPPKHIKPVELELNEEEQQINTTTWALKAKPWNNQTQKLNGMDIENKQELIAYMRYFAATSWSKIDYIKRIANTGKKFLVFSMLTQPLKHIKETLWVEAGIKAEIYGGDTRVDDKRKMLRDWRDGKISVMLISIKAGGAGLNLTQTNLAMFLDAPHNEAQFIQAADRIHRIGQKNEVTIEQLIAPGTVDEFAWAHMNEKGGWLFHFYNTQ